MNIQYIQLIIPVCVALSGWLLVHHLTSKRDHKNKKREIALEYQISAYRELLRATSENINNREDFIRFRKAVSDIMLFGTQEQVNLTREMLEQFATGQSVESGKLLIKIRNDLRKSLDLSQDEEWAGIMLSWQDHEPDAKKTAIQQVDQINC